MRQMNFSTSIWLLTLVAFVTAQVPLGGRCPEVKIVDKFDVNEYLGVWYEQSKYPFIAEIGKKCIYARYTAGDNDTVNVLNVGINRLTGSDSKVNGTAKLVAPGQLVVSFFESAKPSTDPNYLVLATDYTNYAVVYSCTSATRFLHFSNVWILTRERQPKAEIVIEARKVLEENRISTTFLIDTVQNDCSFQNVTLTESYVVEQTLNA